MYRKESNLEMSLFQPITAPQVGRLLSIHMWNNILYGIIYVYRSLGSALE